jgi:hypothetical protein
MVSSRMQRFAWRQVPGVDHELLLGADFEHVAHCRTNLAVGAKDLDAFRRVLEMLDVIVGIEGGEPYDAAVAALHAPHPVCTENWIRLDARQRLGNPAT